MHPWPNPCADEFVIGLSSMTWYAVEWNVAPDLGQAVDNLGTAPAMMAGPYSGTTPNSAPPGHATVEDHDSQSNSPYRDLKTLIGQSAPDLLAVHGVGTDIAGQLLITAGDNPERLRSDASFAALCGVSPLLASSGKTNRHRLNRGGDRAANSALHRVVIVRMKSHPETRAYVQRRTSQGMSKREIIRCLKRYVARELLPHIKTAAQDRPDLKLPSIAA